MTIDLVQKAGMEIILCQCLEGCGTMRCKCRKNMLVCTGTSKCKIRELHASTKAMTRVISIILIMGATRENKLNIATIHLVTEMHNLALLLYSLNIKPKTNCP